MAHQTEDRDELLIAPPGRYFVMTGALWHIALDVTIMSKDDTYTAELLCTEEREGIRAQTLRAYESEICPACLLR